MAEWLFEQGIGEDRAILVEDGTILAAELELHAPTLRVGAIVPASLIAVERGRAVIATDAGEALLDRAPPGLSIGRKLTVEIVREAIPEPGRAKRAKAVLSESPPRPAPSLAERISATALPVRRPGAHEADAFEAAGWSELLDEAETGEIVFPRGALRMTATPAMTLFDVDGDAPLDTLAIAAAEAVARAIRRHRIGGSIGVDFPTIAGKAARQAVAGAIDAVLPAPFERTAVNGFGFLQIVRPRPRASLPEVIRGDPVGAASRAALRRLERVPPGDPNRHRLPAAVIARLEAHPEWLAELVRRTGRIPIFAA